MDGNSKFRDSQIMVAQRIYLMVQGAVVLMVMGLFHFMDRETASIVASALFVVANGFIIYWEGFRLGRKKSASFIGTAIYSLLFVLPIAGFRFFAGGVPLSELQIGPVSGPQLHRMSNMAFLLLLVCYFLDLWLSNKKKGEQ